MLEDRGSPVCHACCGDNMGVKASVECHVSSYAGGGVALRGLGGGGGGGDDEA